MNLGVQYYRAPFPEEKYWKSDFARIKDSGLNTVQLWVLWAWVESKPGHFCFDDYDRLVELADKNDLGVILSTIAEIQPYWIHREVPGSEMIDNMGIKVVSSNRGECHFGLTPGGCTDHPGVWERMQVFLRKVTEQYRGAKNLRGWDAWNELRWNVNADSLVCFCDYTINAFHRWLEQKYGSLDELNKIWKRRYGSFEEILPGKLPDRPYTEMMAFEHFITWRANQHGKKRYDLIKSLDPDKPVTVHAATPSPLMGGWGNDHAINRGNDWFYADDKKWILTAFLNILDKDHLLQMESCYVYDDPAGCPAALRKGPISIDGDKLIIDSNASAFDLGSGNVDGDVEGIDEIVMVWYANFENDHWPHLSRDLRVYDASNYDPTDDEKDNDEPELKAQAKLGDMQVG